MPVPLEDSQDWDCLSSGSEPRQLSFTQGQAHSAHTVNLREAGKLGVEANTRALTLKHHPEEYMHQVKTGQLSGRAPRRTPHVDTASYLGGSLLEMLCLPTDNPGTGPWSAGSGDRRAGHTSPGSSGPWPGSWQPARSLPQ